MKAEIRTKEEARRVFLQRRNLVEEQKRMNAGKKVAEHLLYIDEVKAAQNVFLYASYKSEVPTKEIFLKLKEQGKQIAMPKVDGVRMTFYPVSSWEELVPGYQNIPEPVADGKEPMIPKKTDVMILPGVAFDKSGNRIGYGAGYYDRYLEELGSDLPVCVGLAYECQISKEKLPTESFDKKVQYLVMERKVVGTQKVRTNSPVAAGAWGDFIAKVFDIIMKALKK